MSESARFSFELVGQDFLVDLQDFMYARLEKVFPERLSPEYEEADERHNELYEFIKAAVSDDLQAKLFELVDLHSEMSTRAMEVVYRHGFSDGLRFILQTLTPSS